MGILLDFSRWLLGDSTPALISVQSRSCAVEPMEPRVMLNADPLYVGAVYIEKDGGDDSRGDKFELSFTGGADGTQLSRVTIDGDQYAPGFSRGDAIFDTQDTGLGTVGAVPLTIDSDNGIDDVSWQVDDGTSLLILTFSGFHAGEKFVFTIDVDEVEDYDDFADPPITDPDVINPGLDPITSGVEFQGSRLIAEFRAPHYQDATADGEFLNDYDLDTDNTRLALSENNVDKLPDRTAGAIAQLQQQPKPISIAGTVYHDIDLDLSQDADEPGLPGVTLALWKSESGSYADTGQRAITDAVGDYIFGRELDLLPGVYEVRETQPNDYFSVGAVPGTVEGVPSGHTVDGDPDALTEIGILLGDSDALDYDFAEALPARIGGFVYHDRDQDGRRDPGEEEGIGGVPVQVIPVDTIAPQGTVTVTTQADGSYTATGLVPGRYRVVQAEQPADYWDWLDAAGTVVGVVVGAAVNPGDHIEGIKLGGGQAGIEYNFGEVMPVGISGNVHESDPNGDCFVLDMEHPPIANVKIQLFNSLDQLVAETRTDADGNYSFTQQWPGTYTVKETQPDGYFQGSQRVGWVEGDTIGNVPDDDVLADVVLASGQVGVHYDFCEHPPARISGHVYHDESNDGVFDDEEDPIEGARLELYDAAGNLVATTTTDPEGLYEFTGLKQGTYRVVERQPDGYLDGLDAAGTVAGQTVGSAVNPGDEIVGVGLKWRETGIDYDFGELLTGTIRGNVHEADPYGNCFVIGIEHTPIVGVTILLQDAQGNVVDQTKTDLNGDYSFTDLTPGVYTVVENQPEGYLQGGSRVGWVDDVHSGQQVGRDILQGIEIESGQSGVYYDFCEPLPASLSGYVYHDENNNGRFDSGEAPIAGATVTLLDSDGQAVATDRTTVQGFYRFTELYQDTYTVIESQPEGWFDGRDAAGTIGGIVVGSAVNPGDKIAGVALQVGQRGVHYDFGELTPASISGYVFQDGPTIITDDGLPPADLPAIRDGQRTPDDTPIAGVVLELRQGVTGDPVMGNEALPGHYGPGPIRTTTDARGYYEFTGLERGNYAVYQVHPEEYVDSRDTPGTQSGIVFNLGEPISEAVLRTLNVDPNNDAIVRIGLPPGMASQNNNFSEVRVERILPPPPDEPPIFVPPPVVEIPLPPVQPAVFVVPLVPGKPPVLVAGGSGGMGYAWHLSVINSGRPRGAAPATFGTTTFWLTGAELLTVAWDAERLSHGTWTMARQTREGRLLRFDNEHTFGLPGAVPVVGDFNGDGIDEIAIYYKGEWYIDLNGNGLWDETDLWAKLGTEADQPVVGDWDGDGKDDIGIYGPAWPGDPRAVREEPGLPDSFNLRMHKVKNVPPQPDEATGGSRAMQLTSKGRVRADLIDHVFHYGTPGDRAVSGDWNGDGIAAIGIFRDGRWHLDIDADGRWSQADVAFIFGQAGDLPVVGDFNSDGIDEVGVVRGGRWILDLNGNRELDAADKTLDFGEGGGQPAVGDFNGDGIDDAALYHDGGPNVGSQARRS